MRVIVGALLLGACSQSVVPVSDVRPFRPITTSCKDTADTRRQVLRHNSVLDSIKSGRDVVYGDDCVQAKPKTTS